MRRRETGPDRDGVIPIQPEFYGDEELAKLREQSWAQLELAVPHMTDEEREFMAPQIRWQIAQMTEEQRKAYRWAQEDWGQEDTPA